MCSSASLFPSSLPHPQEQKTIARDRRRNMEDTFPVIDAEKINCEEGECKKLREACERWGCFMADMKKVVEALVVTWDKMHSALYMRPWVSMTCVPHKLCRFSVLNLMTRSTRVNIGQKMAESLGLVVADFEDWLCEFKFNKYKLQPRNNRSSNTHRFRVLNHSQR
ncbi:hypothetical protein AAZX31_11G087400 [Glycine max]|nr:hypothetical protein GLYMA_11G089200v4 [Glycine max]KAH1158254.1 hypothetical protein GYH30_030478 [Glycine max]